MYKREVSKFTCTYVLLLQWWEHSKATINLEFNLSNNVISLELDEKSYILLL